MNLPVIRRRVELLSKFHARQFLVLWQKPPGALQAQDDRRLQVTPGVSLVEYVSEIGDNYPDELHRPRTDRLDRRGLAVLPSDNSTFAAV